LAARQDGLRWQSFEAYCSPAAGGGAEHEAVSARAAHDLGVHASDLAHAAPGMQVMRELHAFLAGRTVVTAAREPFLTWWRAPGAAPAVEALDLAQIAALTMPGRLATESEGLATALLGRPPEGGPRALEPAHLRAALGVLAARVLAQGESLRALLVHALEGARRALERTDAGSAASLALALALLEHPTVWREPARALEPEGYELRDGRLSDACRAYPSLLTALDACQPRWRRGAGEAEASTGPAVRLEEERTLDEHDLRMLDEIFQERLPRHFGACAGGSGAESYRPGQHGVARAIADGFGLRELRLIHAPTGTGKTLAYLVPTLLWALRNQTRVGIATYTRVLQEQARERDVPLALECLRSALDISGLRVAVLKGRQNYLCWRALGLHAPMPDDPGEEQLAWAQLALFALSDESGDLDRTSTRAPLANLEPERYRRAAERLMQSVRSETGCCSLAADRSTCAADAAWRAAEHAHVVITNHALALARRDFFQHVVFDECEHLHDVAQNAFSSALGLRELDTALLRLGGSDERKPLGRILLLAPPGSAAAVGAQTCLITLSRARAALQELSGQCQAFKTWRGSRVRERLESDQHSLFREYALEHGAALLASHGALGQHMGELLTAVARLQEHLDSALPAREVARLRRTLEVQRAELEEQRAAVLAWIPRDGAGRPSFGNETFHDLETSVGGEDKLVTRVLLPHEYLGRHYYPTLAGAVFLSATTWLRGGFEAAARYLGLARAAEPAEGEERTGVRLEVFRAPEAFDYSRVFLAVPEDAPATSDKGAHLDYTARFIAYLAERTRGRLLALFTNAEDVAAVGARLERFFETRGLPFWWQRMRGTTKEELGQLFRTRIDSVLLGLDAFWYGADFPGSTLEYLVIVRLPYGVPDRYHHAQCAVLGTSEQRRTIYLPRALAKFRQGFGRLMRKEGDRGCVFVLDRRALEPRHRAFLQELPTRGILASEAEAGPESERLSLLRRAPSEACLDEALAFMGLRADARRRGLAQAFSGWRLAPEA
jgi:ATP-dependent DNA helicase DinG